MAWVRGARLAAVLCLGCLIGCGGEDATTPSAPSAPPPPVAGITATVGANGTNSHELTVASGGTVRITLTWADAGVDLDLYLLSSDCNGLPVIDCPPLTFSAALSGTREQIDRTLGTGERYRLWIDSDGGSAQSYTLEVTGAVVNISAAQPDLHLRCSLAQAPLRGCGSGTCVFASSSGFEGTATLACANTPQGLQCGFGPRTVTPSEQEARKAGLTVIVLPDARAGTYPLEIVLSGAGISRSFRMEVVAIQLAPASVRSDVMTVTGCSGYDFDGSPLGDVRLFTSTFVGAWRFRARGSLCRQVLSESDGSFVFEIPHSCYAVDEPVYLTSGGLETCVTPPFRPGRRLHALLLGRSSCP